MRRLKENENIDNKNIWTPIEILPKESGEYWATVVNDNNRTMSVKDVFFQKDTGSFQEVGKGFIENGDIITAWMKQKKPSVYSPFLVYAHHFDGSYRKVILVDTVAGLSEILYFEQKCDFPAPLVIALTEKNIIYDKIDSGLEEQCYVIEKDIEGFPEKINVNKMEEYSDVKFGYAYTEEELDSLLEMELNFFTKRLAF